jgi:hypothetical protein
LQLAVNAASRTARTAVFEYSCTAVLMEKIGS